MSFNIPENYLYTKDHEWALIQSNIATIGITEFAKDQLGEVVYVDLPKVGDKLNQNQTFGVVESVKAVSDLYAPISGTVTEINASLLDNPDSLNTSPNTDGWLIKVQIASESEIPGLMKSEDYKKLITQS
ncbi:MAG: glycine cleavage system protein GcvH [Pseudobdellovibrio sp.]|jgi:glycine cleavage system H protein